MHAIVVSLAPLLLAHLLGDFVFQSSRMVAAKQRLQFRSHLWHVAIHSFCAYALLGVWALWKVPLAIFCTHLLIDLTKETIAKFLLDNSNMAPPKTRIKLTLFVIDQALHFFVIVLISNFVVEPIHSHFWYATAGDIWLKGCLLGSGVIAAVWVGGVLIGMLCEPLVWQINQQPNPQNLEGFPRGGQIIGWIERFLILVLVMQQQYVAVGFLVTAKSILRFGEIKDSQARMETEYVIIGTMLSFAWGIAVALVTNWVLEIVYT